MSAHGSSSLVRSMSRSYCLGTFLVLFALTSHADAATLLVNGGLLTGAIGVDVGGTLYNVEFVDGSCIDLFTGCDNTSDFTFTTADEALAAAEALLSFVFIDGSDGFFDSQPANINGCFSLAAIGKPWVCSVLIPYEFDADSVSSRIAQNGDGVVFSDTATLTLLSSSALNTAPLTQSVYARFTPADATPVPEPASLTLLGLGLAGMAGRRWRQRKRA